LMGKASDIEPGGIPDPPNSQVFPASPTRKTKTWRWLIWLVVLPFLWLIFRQVDFTTLLAVLRNLSLLELGALAVVNAFVLLSLSSRWWLILVGKGKPISYWQLGLYRLAAFSISYFTPGPQFGGEPLQIQLLRVRHGMSGSQAGASVALDKSLELAVNFGFLVFGVLVALVLGLLPGRSSGLFLAVAIALLLIPLIHLSLAARGRRPIASMLMALPSRWRRMMLVDRLISIVQSTEEQVASYLTSQPLWVLAALAASVGSWVLLVGEYWLMARFLGLELSIWMAVAALTAARLAILLPSPGGLGTLEASQVLAFSALTNSPAAGAALALVIRGRDLIFGGAGLLIVGWLGVEAIPERGLMEDDRIRPIGERGK
jgi:uncharacterized protein (TIRG00374 family)